MINIVVNGNTITVPAGSMICVTGGDVYVDGKPYFDSKDAKTVDIRIEGNCGSLNVNRCNTIQVTGDVAGAINAGGNVSVGGSVTDGNVNAGGSVTCGDVSGDVDAGGSVRCGKVGGSVDAGGSVHHN